jgi:hypothetical protein
MADETTDVTTAPDLDTNEPARVQVAMNDDGTMTLQQGSQTLTVDDPGAENASSALIAELLGDNATETINPVKVMVSDKSLIFGIKKLSHRESTALARKRLRNGPNGEITPNIDTNLTLRLLALSECVFRNEGMGAAAKWVLMWSYEELGGTETSKGLIDNSTPAADDLIFGLLNEIWMANPTIAPNFLANVERELNQ